MTAAWPERDAVFDAVPFDGVPPLTAEPVQHRVVEVLGLFDSWANVRDGWPLVYGRTRCGRRMQVDRTNHHGRPCKTCYRTEG